MTLVKKDLKSVSNSQYEPCHCEGVFPEAVFLRVGALERSETSKQSPVLARRLLRKGCPELVEGSARNDILRIAANLYDLWTCSTFFIPQPSHILLITSHFFHPSSQSHPHTLLRGMNAHPSPPAAATMPIYKTASCQN